MPIRDSSQSAELQLPELFLFAERDAARKAECLLTGNAGGGFGVSSLHAVAVPFALTRVSQH